jgi:hypothetical protein
VLYSSTYLSLVDANNFLDSEHFYLFICCNKLVFSGEEWLVALPSSKLEDPSPPLAVHDCVHRKKEVVIVVHLVDVCGVIIELQYGIFLQQNSDSPIQS